MPMPCYLILEGASQGKIEVSAKATGQEGKIQVQGLDHTIAIPNNPQNGLPSGKRVHGPMTLTKEIDESSPKLFQALCTGERMKSVVLEFYRIAETGKEEKYYSVKLEAAILTSIRSWTPNCLMGENRQMGHMEDIAFSYNKIIWTFESDGIEAQDAWLEAAS